MITQCSGRFGGAGVKEKQQEEKKKNRMDADEKEREALLSGVSMR